MAQAQKRLVDSTTSRASQHGKYKLDALDAARIARHLVVCEPTEAAVSNLIAQARHSIPGLTETSEIIKILHHNPELMLVTARKSRLDTAASTGESLIAFLPLNLLGLQHLALGTFNAAKPDLRLLAKPHEKPAGVYLWCVYAPGPLAASMALLMQRLSSDRYDGVNIYARLATEEGRHFSQVLGFTQGIVVEDIEAPNVWVFPRKPHVPLYDSYVPGAGKSVIGITVARTFEDLLRVNAIRSAVYIGEQECPYDEEYDGNDMSGTHLLAYLGGEPIGSLRLRFFAGFAKIERLAIRKEFRKSKAAFELVRASFKFCQKKGYGRIYAHSQARLVDFWHRFGFRELEGGKQFVFSDFDYVEMIAHLEPDPAALTLGIDPYILIRPEGRWHVPGILERSATRAVTRPSVDKKH